MTDYDVFAALLGDHWHEILAMCIGSFVIGFLTNIIMIAWDRRKR